jgi:hypothetical protein
MFGVRSWEYMDNMYFIRQTNEVFFIFYHVIMCSYGHL